MPNRRRRKCSICLYSNPQVTIDILRNFLPQSLKQSERRFRPVVVDEVAEMIDLAIKEGVEFCAIRGLNCTDTMCDGGQLSRGETISDVSAALSEQFLYSVLLGSQGS